MKKKILYLFAAIALISCKKNNEDNGTMSVSLTDAPVELLQVNIDLQGVKIQYPTIGWVDLKTQVGVYNLLEFQNDSSIVIVDKDDVPLGKVTQCRLILGDSNSVMALDSSIHPLELSSQDETGLKINLNQIINSNQNLAILLDFDASQSVILKNDSTFKLKPVLKLKKMVN